MGEGGTSGVANVTLASTDLILAGAINTAILPLANNGGPTQTHLLVANSPALDRGDNTLVPPGVTTDQRGQARILNSRVDIGAVEGTGVVQANSVDLIVQNTTVSTATLSTNQSFTINTTVRNQGTGTATSAATTLRYFLSNDATVDTNDTQLATDNIPGLAVNGTSAQNATVTAPSTAGTYYIGVCVNAVTGETSTTNNCSGAIQITVTSGGTGSGSDLIVIEPVAVSPTTLTRGQRFSITATVRNQGTNSTNGSSTLRFYRSIDDTLSTTTDNTQLFIRSISTLVAGASSAAQTFSATAPTTDGIYHIIACISTVTNESNTANNCSAPVRITVGTVTPPAQPDLVVEGPTVSATDLTPGQAVTFNATVRNRGTGASPTSTLRYYLSNDNTFATGDTELATDAIGTLAANATSPQNAALTAPTAAGNYWLGACVDTVTNESSTSNNCTTGIAITVTQTATNLSVLLAGFTPNPVMANSGAGCNAATSPDWSYRAIVSEQSGEVGLEVTMFTVDLYDGEGTLLDHIEQTATEFAAQFDDCGTGSATLSAGAAMCSDRCAALGGQTSGHVEITVYGTDENNREVMAIGKARLDRNSASGTAPNRVSVGSESSGHEVTEGPR